MPSYFCLLFVFFICFSSASIAQPDWIQLRKNLDQVKDEQALVDSLNLYASTYVRQDPNQSLSWANEALNLARQLSDSAGVAAANRNLGEAYKVKADFPAAQQFYQKSLEGFESLKDTAQVAFIYNKLGAIQRSVGENLQALDHFTSASFFYSALGDSTGVAGALNNIGIIYYTQGNYPVALDYFDQSLAYWQALDNERGMAFNLHNIGNILVEQKRFDEAEKHFLQAVVIKEKRGDKRDLYTTVLNLGVVYYETQRYPEAKRYFERAQSIAEELNDPGALATVYSNFGDLAKVERNWRRALQLYHQSRWYADEASDPRLQSQAYTSLGAVHLQSMRFDSASYYLEKGLNLGKQAGSPLLVQQAYLKLSEMWVAKDDHERAYEYRLLYEALQDSLWNAENSQKVAQFEARFNTEKRLKMLEYLLQENKLQTREKALREERRELTNRIIWVAGGVLFLVVISVVWAYKRLRKVNRLLSVQNRSIRLRNEDIKKQKEEKEVLLKEIHHRVKNNLQVINSLLRLQSHQIDDPAVVQLFQECQNRVVSMALIHEKMYESQDLAHIDLKDYVVLLANNLISTYRLTRDIRLKVDIDVPQINIDTLVPLGLILNEIISNSLKYAFPERLEGEINVSIKQLKKGRFEMSISDDGVGLPDELDFKTAPTLGMELIRTLAEQLDGEAELKPGSGVGFRITFRELAKSGF